MTAFFCIGSKSSIRVTQDIQNVYMRLSERGLTPRGGTQIDSVHVHPMFRNRSPNEENLSGHSDTNHFFLMFEANIADISRLSQNRIVVRTSTTTINCHAEFDSNPTALPDMIVLRNLQTIARQIGINEARLNNSLNAAANTRIGAATSDSRTVTPRTSSPQPYQRTLDTLRLIVNLRKVTTPSPDRLLILAKISR